MESGKGSGLFLKGEREGESVVAVVVTYNRKDLLLECLSGLARQSRPIDGLILVDNASTDGTPGLLHEQGLVEVLPEENVSEIQEFVSRPKRMGGLPTVVLRMNENTGGAGGFHEGLKRAYLAGADWIWLMDDDIEPDSRCLEGLLSFSGLSKCLHPRKYLRNDVPHVWEGYYDYRTGKRIFQDDPSFKKGFAFSTTNTGCFEGMLVHRSIVDAIGYPDRRFFIGMDDSLYGFMAHFHTPVLYLRDPFVRKKAEAPAGYAPISDRSLYYGMRNAFLFRETFNRLVPEYRWRRTFYLGVKFVDYALNILQNRKKKLQGYRCLIKGLSDGMRGRFGKGI
ncbi:MAG: glycosyltransferase family 2 protein [Nitrospiraceae bacterium]|nr:glycosyltransferase family 2 protein [Nitrospiraceae bacterium]